jgi:hypothetical protein
MKSCLKKKDQVLTKREKIVACMGNVKDKSIYKLCGVSREYAYYIIKQERDLED